MCGPELLGSLFSLIMRVLHAHVLSSQPRQGQRAQQLTTNHQGGL
jgi:hypothetical protein